MLHFMKRAAFLAALFLSFGASAQTDWPTKPVNMVVPYPAGGLNDAVARVYADKLTAILGKTVVVDNRAGAATTVASNSVAKATPDGYTIYAAGTSLVINPTLQGNVQYDPHKSFAPISNLAHSTHVYFAHPSQPAKSMAELIDSIRKEPRKYSMATPGMGTAPHISAHLLALEAGMAAPGVSVAYNLGCGGEGYSVAQVLAAVERQTGVVLPVDGGYLIA